MKEYLTKNSNGDYQLVNHRFSDDDIKIQDGAELCTLLKEYLIFWKGTKNKRPHYDDWLECYHTADDYLNEYEDAKIIWKREPKYKEFLNANDNYNLVMLPEHAGDDERSGLIEVPDNMNYAYYTTQGIRFTSQDTSYFYGRCLWQRYTQPESLPFVDDEAQSINDQYAEIEQVRQQSIDATLAERQSTYGNFEDVAFVTENIINVLKKCNYNKMPHTHKMAMYMIASKMARIVNGDCDHLDSWHDIGGYAKLIENLIKGNNNG